MRRVVPALEAALETPLPGIVERVAVVDRAGWVRANLATFSGLFGRLEGDLLDQIVPPGAGLAKASLALANRWVTTRQFGLLLGFMGQRVLGQYDLALLSAEAEPGQLLFVEENIRHTARDARRAARRRSGPGSRSTRRPTPSSSRPTPGCGRTSPTASSGSSAACRASAADLGPGRLAGARARAPRRRRALAGAPDVGRAAPPASGRPRP